MSCVIVAIDFSDVTDALIEAAIKYALAGGVSAVLVHVAPPDVGFSMGETSTDLPPQAVAELVEERRKKLRVLAERMSAAVTAETILMQGSAEHGILDEAAKRIAELIIIGSHGHGRLYDLIVGSVANAVIRQSTCPVLVVPSMKN